MKRDDGGRVGHHTSVLVDAVLVDMLPGGTRLVPCAAAQPALAASVCCSCKAPYAMCLLQATTTQLLNCCLAVQWAIEEHCGVCSTSFRARQRPQAPWPQAPWPQAPGPAAGSHSCCRWQLRGRGPPASCTAARPSWPPRRRSCRCCCRCCCYLPPGSARSLLGCTSAWWGDTPSTCGGGGREG